MPKQARLNRFYSNYVVFDKFIATKSKTPSSAHVKQNTYIAAWNNGKYTFGNIKRMIRLSIRGKCAFPIFHWDKSTQDVEIAIQVLLPIEKNENDLSRTLKWSKTFAWITVKDYVSSIQGHWIDGVYKIEENCYLELSSGKNTCTFICIQYLLQRNNIAIQAGDRQFLHTFAVIAFNSKLIIIIFTSNNDYSTVKQTFTNKHDNNKIF